MPSEVSGADRAVRPGTFVSATGDGAVDEVWIQVGRFTVVGHTYLYIEDIDDAPVEAIAGFLDSICVDRDAFDAIFGP